MPGDGNELLDDGGEGLEDGGDGGVGIDGVDGEDVDDGGVGIDGVDGDDVDEGDEGGVGGDLLLWLAQPLMASVRAKTRGRLGFVSISGLPD